MRFVGDARKRALRGKEKKTSMRIYSPLHRLDGTHRTRGPRSNGENSQLSRNFYSFFLFLLICTCVLCGRCEVAIAWGTLLECGQRLRGKSALSDCVKRKKRNPVNMLVGFFSLVVAARVCLLCVDASSCVPTRSPDERVVPGFFLLDQSGAWRARHPRGACKKKVWILAGRY